MNPPNLIESVFQFIFVFRSRLNTELEQSGLSAAPMHIKLLKMISGMPDCTAQKIAQILHRDKAQINRALQDMLLKNYVIKAPNPDDKRSQLLRITAQGEAALQAMKDIEISISNSMTQDIPEKELAHFIAMIDKFRDNL